MPKKLTELDKQEIIRNFISGETIQQLSEKYNLSKITVSRHLKKNIGDIKYKEIIKNNKNKKNKKNKLEINQRLISDNFNLDENKEEIFKDENSSFNESFMEIEPLNYEIDNQPQKDLSSIPISDVQLPKILYMVVDKNIELGIKYLRDYPEWQFLSEEELNRKTIEIFFDLKIAKRFCNKEQKVIKVPNTEVFKIAAPHLLKKGISRIVSPNILIAL